MSLPAFNLHRDVIPLLPRKSWVPLKLSGCFLLVVTLHSSTCITYSWEQWEHKAYHGASQTLFKGGLGCNFHKLSIYVILLSTVCWCSTSRRSGQLLTKHIIYIWCHGPDLYHKSFVYINNLGINMYHEQPFCEHPLPFLCHSSLYYFLLRAV